MRRGLKKSSACIAGAHRRRGACHSLGCRTSAQKWGVNRELVRTIELRLMLARRGLFSEIVAFVEVTCQVWGVAYTPPAPPFQIWVASLRTRARLKLNWQRKIEARFEISHYRPWTKQVI